MKKQKQEERFDLDSIPSILTGKSAPIIKKPFRQRAAEWLHIQNEKCRREWERYKRERERRRSEKKAIPSVGEIEKELLRARRSRRRAGIVRNIVLALLVLAAMLCAAAVYLPITPVAGDSMHPTLQDGDVIVCTRTQEVQRGDVVLFEGAHGRTWVKRVIALAGDEVNILEDGTVTVNQKVLDEPYVSVLTRGSCDIEFPYIVPYKRVFVLGDHRALSVDSRHAILGCVLQEQIIGRAEFRIYPFERAGRID